MARPITTEILELRGLTGVQKLVLVAIASHGQTAFPSQRRLAMLTSLGVRTVKRAVTELRAKGILATHHDRASLTYTVVMGGATQAPVVPDRPLGGATQAPLMVPQWPPNSKGNSQENSPPIAPLKGGRRRRRHEAEADPNWTPF
jgi:DNA-binding transcriptional MocR family regulator